MRLQTCHGWLGVCWRHDTDVSRTGCVRLGSGTRRVSFYESLVGGGLRLSGSSSGSNGSVRVYRSDMRTLWSTVGGVEGGRRDAVSDSDWGEYLRTKGRDPVLRWI
jgi:hypothetical protein